MTGRHFTHLILVLALLFSIAGATNAGAASSSGTTIPPATQIVDAGGAVWTVSGGVVYVNGGLAGYSNAVIALLYLNGVVYQENNAKSWWAWTGSAWNSVASPLGGVVNGVCGASNGISLSSIPSTNLCSSGTASTVGGTGPWYWNCAGSNGGGFANCSASILRVDGTCGTVNGASLSSVPTANLCSAGTPSTVGGNGPWYWNCAGINGGSFANCSASLAGRASASGTSIPPASQIVDVGGAVWTVAGGVIYVNGSLAGYSTAVVELLYLNGIIYQQNSTGSWWTWTGSAWNSVSSPLGGVVNGACGASNGMNLSAAPATNLCSAGIASSVTGNGPWYWNCAGVNGGTLASCSATIQRIDGACGASNGVSASAAPKANLCSAGTPSTVAGNGPWYWNCTGVNGGNVASCSAPVQRLDGACGASNGVTLASIPTANLCSAGTPSSVSGNGPWYWNCAGSSGGSVANCSAAVQRINGACGSSNGKGLSSIPTTNLCGVGTPSAVSGTGPWYWNCAGSSGGSAANCSATILPVNGACGASNGTSLSSAPATNLCSAGTPSSVTGNGPWYWNCAGLYGGTLSNCSASLRAAADATPPSVPTNVVAAVASTRQINLSWTASTDNVGVAGYKVYRNSAQIGTTAVPSYSDTGLIASTTYTYAVSAYDAAGNNSAASTPVSANTGSSGTARSKLGINLDWITDWGDHAMMFVDVMKIARGFGTPARYYDPTNAPVPLDTNGWPTTDFGVTFISNSQDPLDRPLTTTFPSMFGTYNLSFTGQATISGAGCCQIQNTAYDAQTNTTTAQVVVGPTDNQVALVFTNTSGGVQNLKLLRPGYASGTSQVFTTQLLTALAPFSVIRFMTPLLTNNSPVTSWQGRTSATNPTQNTATGVAWEYVVQLANASGADIWINIPQGVNLTDNTSNNYVTQLAQLLKATLNPGIHVYVEYSNELWNGTFTQFQANVNAAVNDVTSNTDPTLDYDNSSNSYYWALRRTAHQTVRISQLFKTVYGASAMNTIIRPVLMSQYVQPYFAEDSLIYINANFGAPNQYLYAIGGAPYFWTSDAYSDVNGLFAALQNGTNQNTLPQFFGGQAYSGVINYALPQPTYKTLADYYGLKHVAYEGGINLGDGGGTNPALSEQSLSDSRNNLLIQQTLADWFGCGNDLFMYYSLATFPGDYYGLFEDLSLATPKSTAMATVSSTPLSSYSVCTSTLTNQLYVH